MNNEVIQTNDQMPTMLESDAPYVSPTIMLLRKDQRPNPSTLCEACPASVWYITRGQLVCYCRVLKVRTWDKMHPNPMTACDGYQMAIEEMAEKQN